MAQANNNNESVGGANHHNRKEDEWGWSWALEHAHQADILIGGG